MTPRLSKLEKDALVMAAGDVLAGDAEAFFNGGAELDDPPRRPEEREAVRLAAALDSAVRKLQR